MSMDEYTKYLKTDVTISEPQMLTYPIGNRKPAEREGVNIKIKVENAAPDTYFSGNVVFIGVNLLITNRKEGIGSRSERWKLSVVKSRVNENPEVRGKYSKDQLSLNERFPLTTQDEKKHGEILFPGESVEYNLAVPPEEVPYFDMKVEGTVSRRHLFHVVQRVNAFDKYTTPLIEEIFWDLDNIQIESRLRELAKSIPEISSESSFKDLYELKLCVENTASKATQLLDEINIVYRAIKHIDARGFIKQVWGKHIVGVQEACKKIQEAYSSSDAKTIADAVDNLKKLLLSTDECTKKQSEFVSPFYNE